VAGVFTLGFGVGASVLTNNVAAIGALVNGVWPMREVARLEAERRHLLEMEIKASAGGAPFPEATAVPAMPDRADRAAPPSAAESRPAPAVPPDVAARPAPRKLPVRGRPRTTRGKAAG